LADVQRDLFVIGARLAASRPDRELQRGTIPDLDPGRTESLEAWIDRLDSELPELDAFILPGGSRVAAQLHVARTVCRRAERSVTALLDELPALGEVILPFINRLSDLLFALARWANAGTNVGDVRWLPVRELDR
jgi:cob(I)alamin adenosyltransferase